LAPIAVVGGGQLKFVPNSTETIQHSAAANGGSGLADQKT